MAADFVVTIYADSGNGALCQAIRFNKSLGDGITMLFSSIHPRSAQ